MELREIGMLEETGTLESTRSRSSALRVAVAPAGAHIGGDFSSPPEAVAEPPTAACAGIESPRFSWRETRGLGFIAPDQSCAR
jgi:vacuolar-type H+-ATPase catalytic subunit A/Vma1